VVVLTPLLGGEVAKTCECGATGIYSPVLERSTFYRNRRLCRACVRRKQGTPEARRREAELKRARLARMREEDPEAWKAFRAAGAAANARYARRHPERKRAGDRRWRRANPEKTAAAQRRYIERHPEERRMTLIGTAERRGRRLKSLDEVERTQNRTGRKLPIEPFRGWVEELLEREARKLRFDGHSPSEAETAAKQHVAALLGVSIRTVYRYRYELATVWEGIVDHAVSRHGGYHILDLYPNLYDLEEAA
jgi:hypothetical protein